MTTSRPARRAGIDSDWTSFGDVIFCRLSDARTRALTPASANVCNEAPGCLSFLLICRDLQALCCDRKRGPERATHECVEAMLPDRGAAQSYETAVRACEPGCRHCQPCRRCQEHSRSRESRTRRCRTPRRRAPL